MWRAMSYYDVVPGPFTPEYPTPERGYDPDFSGVEARCIPTIAAVLLCSLVAITAVTCII